MNLKIVLLSVGLSTAFGSQAQTIKLNLEKGKKYEVTTVSKISSSANVMGQDMETNIDNTTVEAYEVKEVRTNEADLTKTVTKLGMNMQSMGQDMSYDSDKKDNSGPMAEELGKMVNKVKTLTIDASGKIIKEDKEDESATAGMTMLAGPIANGVGLLRSAVIGKEMKGNMTWDDSTNSSGDKIKTTTVGTYTVTGIDGNIATIRFSGIQRMTGTIEQMGQEMGMTGSNKVTTDLKLDLGTGLITESITTVDGTSSIEAMGMSIPVTSKSTTTSTVRSL